MARKMFMRLFPLAIAFVIALAGGASAQSGGTGNISGVVSDPSGAVVKGATVTLTNKGTNQSQTVTTNDDGMYSFVLLRPGTYTVNTTASSFGASTLDVEVQVGRTTDANVTLTAGGVSAVVEVTADKIQTTSSNFDTVQNGAEIANAPINGRRFQDLAVLTPTAQVDPSRGQISLAGQRGINSNINVDGVDYNQPFFGGIRGGERSNSAFTIPQESIREFQVVASGYSAEFGRSSGGIVNAVTKSGTNEFHGSGFVVTRPSRLALGNDFTDALKDQKLGALGIPLTVAPTQNMWGGSVGGPIVKDKLFFFGALEQQKVKLNRSVAYTNLIGVNPTAAQLEPFNTYLATQTAYRQTNDAITYLGKIDWNINSANRFNIRYNHSKNTAKNGVSVGETTLDPTTFRSIPTNGIEGDVNNIVVGQLITNLSSHSINELRLQWAKEDRPRLANAQQVSVVTAIGELGTRTFLPTTQTDKRYQVVDGLTMISGNHTFKVGGEYSKIKIAQIFGFNQFGNYTFSGVNATSDVLNALSATPNVPAGKLGRFDVAGARFNQQIGNLNAAYDMSELAFFGQDSWRVTPRLTINYGLRFEKQFNPSAEANNSPVLSAISAATFPVLGNITGFNPAQIPDSKNEFAPRLGFAYDITGDGKNVLRAYSGIYYARTPGLVLAAPFNNFRNPAGDLSVGLGPSAFNSSTFNQAMFDANNPLYVAIVGPNMAPNTVYRQFAILGINLNTFNLTNLPALTPAQLQTIGDRIQAARSQGAPPLGVFQNANLIGITPDFENPVSYQFGGGIEREQWKNFIIGIDYAWVKTIHLERNSEINIPGGLTPEGYIAYLQSANTPANFTALVNATNNFAALRATNRNIVGIVAPNSIPTNISGAIVTRPRPVSALGSIQLRDSSANQLYKEVTARIRYNTRRMQLNAFYTWSRNLSDDDNERDSGGVLYDDPYTRRGEYYASKLDRTHQFVASPIFYPGKGFEVSSNVRLRSGSPLNALVGSDLNGDNTSGNDRPFVVPGLELPRNYYRNPPIYDVDMRFQKRFTFHETRSIVFSTEFFNILKRSNLQLFQGTSGGSPTLYCVGGTLQRCGLDGVTNPNFLQINNSTNGKINLLNSPGSQPFQVQFGARLYF